MDQREAAAFAAWSLLFLLGCNTMNNQSSSPAPVPELVVPHTSVEVRVDGKLDEACYQSSPLVEQFVVACDPNREPQKTKAWLFWQRERLIFAFECEDADIVAAPPSANKRDVDWQDRAELFLWSGRAEDAYYCAEIAPRGAVHDYLAHFYRKFDSTWSMPGLEYAVRLTPKGYCVEGSISREGLEKMDFRLEPGARWRLGLFRGDFRSGNPDPTWITWVDAKGAQPDFHVAESFGNCVLGPEGH